MPLIFGANWCGDCRSLERAWKAAKSAAPIRQRFRAAKIGVGNFDRMLDIAQRWGGPTRHGIPAAVVVSPEHKVLRAPKPGELSNARRVRDDGVYGLFMPAISSSQAAANCAALRRGTRGAAGAQCFRLSRIRAEISSSPQPLLISSA